MPPVLRQAQDCGRRLIATKPPPIALLLPTWPRPQPRGELAEPTAWNMPPVLRQAQDCGAEVECHGPATDRLLHTWPSPPASPNVAPHPAEPHPHARHRRLALAAQRGAD